MLTAALEAAQLGFRVHPLRPSAKLPALTEWQHRATTDAEQVATWFGEQYAQAGLAIATGQGLLVLDVDPKDGGLESLERLEAEHGRLPKGYRVRTPSGGVHHYLKVPGGVITRNSASKVAAGIDLRGDGGYVAAPPTTLAAGPYSALGALVAVADLPEAPPWLLSASARTPKASVPAPAARAWSDLSDREREQATRHRSRRQTEVARELNAMRDAATPDARDYRGTAWDSGTFAAACTLVRVARVPSPDGVEAELLRARALLTLHAPRDAGFTEADHQRVWDSALRQVTEVSDWDSEPTTLAGPATTPPLAEQPRPDESQRSAATTIADLALRDWELHQDTEHDVFAVPLHGGVPHLAHRLRGGRLGLRQALATAYRREHGKVAPQQALADALVALEGEAMESEPVPLHLRVAEHGGALWVDLGDAAGHVVRITGGSWEVLTTAPVLFTRTELSGAMPLPERGGDLADLWEHVNVALTDRALLLGVLAAAYFPAIPHPVLDLEGEQGSGKSTVTRRLVELTDPSPVPMRKPPRDADAWVTAAAGSWVVAIDNQSTLPEWLSDSLCRASTGDGDVRRRLYTDGGLAVFAFRRQVILNGIDLAGIRGDLAERLVTIRPPRIGDTRRSERDLDEQWQQALPRLLGALFDLVAAVHEHVGEVSEVSEVRARAISGRAGGEVKPLFAFGERMRMADFARILVAVDAVLGTDSLSRYREHAAELAAETLTASPFVSRLVSTLHEPFDGTAALLLSRIASETSTPLPRNWPASTKAVTGELRRNAPALRQQGWEVTDSEDRKNHRTLWRLVPPPRPEIGRPRTSLTSLTSPTVRCRVCSDALTTPRARASGLCARRDIDHEAARFLSITPAPDLTLED